MSGNAAFKQIQKTFKSKFDSWDISSESFIRIKQTKIYKYRVKEDSWDTDTQNIQSNKTLKYFGISNFFNGLVFAYKNKYENNNL